MTVKEVFGLETAVKKLYEAMFLVDPTESSQNWDTVIGTIKTILERAEAEIVSIKKWDVRKLAYKISGKTRGTYILCYFKADGERIQNIEKDVQLSEQIMRVLILSAETREAESLEEAHRKMGTQEDIAGTEAEKEKQQEPKRDKEGLETQNAAEESAEKASTQQETEQAGEPEQSAEPTVVDAIEPEQPDEPTAVDVIEPEQPEQSETEKDS
jgi:small subunit ribosomal protein S6